tara:strand:+ start:1028 stop:1804 length:777 start_codon:yes stop_codon:yes gene_type:complete
MIDFHNHVLPDIDDGSRSLRMSLDMLKYAAEQGITDVINTVHYKHPKMEHKQVDYNLINNEIIQLQNNLNEASIPVTLHSAAEVFFVPDISQLVDDPLATFSKKKYMLIEFQPNLIPELQKKILFNLKMNGVNPIIAHPERYIPVQQNIIIVYDWLNSGCLIQVDAGSILGNFGNKIKKVSEKIIKNGWCQIVGSDAHNDKKRNFCLNDANNIISKWIGKESKKLTKDNPQALINGQDIYIELEEEKQKNNFFLNFFK